MGALATAAEVSHYLNLLFPGRGRAKKKGSSVICQQRKASIPDMKSKPLRSIEVREIRDKCRKWAWKGQYSINFFVSDSESRPPLLLVHGFGASIPHWRRNIATLSQNYTVYAIDLLGFGASDKPKGFAYTMEAWAEVEGKTSEQKYKALGPSFYDGKEGEDLMTFSFEVKRLCNTLEFSDTVAIQMAGFPMNEGWPFGSKTNAAQNERDDISRVPPAFVPEETPQERAIGSEIVLVRPAVSRVKDLLDQAGLLTRSVEDSTLDCVDPASNAGK
ncbi:hypothetical protein GH714_010959 [Hevea brasiliensis]|uniref:AB hydrolase-1 domain-containing protein n=1 Tax=Hevea brasiliensis TaxID=3981 RepID=A0A6A6LTH6_HEVBR|nr:hypothetical protein GH714_010959 [Hevea brasiliensis]